MTFDYYAFKIKELESSLSDLVRTVDRYEEAKRNKNNKEKEEFSKEKEKLVKNILSIEPHLSYLWYEALENEKRFNKNVKNEIRTAWQENLKNVGQPWQEGQVDFCKLPQDMGFSPAGENFKNLPYYSLLLEIPFKLDKPFQSKDERDFYILDNPLKRDKVFKTPMMSASGWKGALRAAMVGRLANWWQSLTEDEKGDRRNCGDFLRRRLQLLRLFGTEKDMGFMEADSGNYLDMAGEECRPKWARLYKKFFGEEKVHVVGRLHFFPTFFEEVSLEVLNPHDREKGTGSKRGPLFLECVPPKPEAKGCFKLLYVPGIFAACRVVPINKIIAYDLKSLAEGIMEMLTVYGFGAKTSSGFGTAGEDPERSGNIKIKIPGHESGESEKTYTFRNFKEFCFKAREAEAFLREERKT